MVRPEHAAADRHRPADHHRPRRCGGIPVGVSDRGIEYKPDTDDPKRVRLTSALPEGVSRAGISYRAAGGLRGTR